MMKPLVIGMVLLTQLLVLSKQTHAQSRKLRSAIEELNTTFERYQQISHFGFDMLLVKEHPFTYDQLSENLDEEHVNDFFSADKDSADRWLVISAYHQKLDASIDELLSMANLDLDYLKSNLQLPMAFSDDDKLFCIKYPEKGGGTYVGTISKMVYVSPLGIDTTFDYEFMREGYYSIVHLPFENKDRYLLLGSVKNCTSCYYESATLIEKEGDDFKELFACEVESRDWDGGIQLDTNTLDLILTFQSDDLNGGCLCDYQSSYYTEPSDTDYYQDTESYQNQSCYYRYSLVNGQYYLVEQKTTVSLPE